MVGAMNAFGKEGRHFNRMAAIMNSAVGHGHMHGEEFVGALSTGLPGAAKSFGVSFKGMSSAISFFTRMGEPAQQVATRLRQTISHLATNATTKGAEALERIGMSTEKMGASIRKTGRLGPVIKELAEHLNSVSKNESNQVLTEAFGGGRFGTQIREATQRWQLMLRTEREVGKAATSKRFNAESAIANRQAAVKLKETWAELSTVLINLGNVILPAAVPALEKLTGVISTAGHAFGGLSPAMQGSIAGFLLLTGPIAHGLGYFAGGVGRALILTRKLAEASSVFQSVLSKNVMTEQSGFRAAFGAASEKSGIAGAWRAAKGFAGALGPSVAAYGIGNIITSATSGDWKDAGFEAGGALAGGVAGFFLSDGNPLGAMIGVGIGSLGGELLSGLFGSESKKISPLQERIARTTGLVTAQYGHLERAGRGLVASEGRVKAARTRMKNATSAMKVAQGHYNAVLQEYGPHSQAALRAETKLTLKVRAHRREVERLKYTTHLAGLSLSTYKTVAERTEVTLRRQIKSLKEQANQFGRAYEKQKQLNPQSKKTSNLAQAYQKTVTELAKAEEKQAQLRQSALQKGGPPLLRFLKNGSNEALTFGRSLKNVTKELEELSEASRNLPFSGVTGEGGFIKINAEGKVEKVNAGGDPIRPRHPRQHGHHHHHAGPRPRPTVSIPGGSRRELKRGDNGSHPLQDVANGDVVIKLKNELDGKVLAESVTRHSTKAANRG
jgi:TP901 family phage tail tape measure protein